MVTRVKCLGCNAVYDGDVCPYCGVPADLKKCPMCQGKTTGKFCSNCGYSFEGKSPVFHVQLPICEPKIQPKNADNQAANKSTVMNGKQFIKPTYESVHNQNHVVYKPFKKRWYETTGGIIALLFIFFPVGVALMWQHKKFNLAVRTLITAFFGVLFIRGFIMRETDETSTSMSSNGSSLSTTKASSSIPKESSSITSSSSKSDDERFKEGVLSVLKYHYDIANENMNGSESAGAMAAYKVNLWLYKSDGEKNIRYRIYYYALYGKEQYIEEFGETDSLRPSVEKSISSCYNNIIQQIVGSFKEEIL